MISDTGSGNPHPGVAVHDVIMTNFRHRSGWRPTGGVRNSDGDCIQCWSNSYNIVFDHLSLSDFDDEAIAINTSCYNVTVQNCLIGEGAWTGHKFAVLIAGQSDKVSFYKNLIYKAEQRSPAVDYDDTSVLIAPSIVADVVNNLVWDWVNYGSGAVWGGKGNFVNNYYYSSTNNTFNRAIQLETQLVPLAVGYGYLSGNYSKNGSNMFATTGTTPASQASAYTVDTYAQLPTLTASAAAAYCYANAGCRVGEIDTTDSAILSVISGNL